LELRTSRQQELPLRLSGYHVQPRRQAHRRSRRG
jgi:hypothetical protein